MPQSTLLDAILEAARSRATDLWLADGEALTLPTEIGEATCLTKLHLRCDQLATLPVEIGSLSELESLEIERSALNTLPDELRHLQALTHLSIETSAHFGLPKSLEGLSSLESLSVTGRSVALPPTIGRLQRLKHLVVGTPYNSKGGGLTSLPAAIGELAALQTVRLRGNSLAAVPPAIGNLVSLRVLDLGANRLERLPEEIGKVTALRELRVDHNQLRELPRSIGSLTSLDVLSASHNRLTMLPAEMGGLSNLQRLYLSDNAIESLPSSIGRLSSLEELIFNNNKVRRLPPEVGGLSSLTRLELDHNELTALPSEIAKLQKLTHLNVADNRLVEFPRELGRLSALKSLRALNNEVRVLPPEAVRLRHLDDIELYDGQPDALSIASLTKLWDVFISHASSDAADVAMPLAKGLKRAGLRVWIDQQEIRIGDSIRAKIDDGLSRSRFGVVILSPAFFERDWTSRELGALLAVEDDGQRVVLPVWHNVTREDVRRYSPLLSDVAAAHTRQGLQPVIASIVDKVLYGADDAPSRIRPSITRQIVEAICVRKDASTFRDLMHSHTNVLCRALGVVEDHFGASYSNFDGVPALTLSASSPSAGYTVKSYLLFGSFEDRMFDANGVPLGDLETNTERIRAAHDRVRLAGGREDTPFDRLVSADHRFVWPFDSEGGLGRGQPSILVCGRRHGLGKPERNALNALNTRLAGLGIRVRSYDWLIDAAAAMERDRARKPRW
jgi:Leucine-rich repeat (LRR) protein